MGPMLKKAFPGLILLALVLFPLVGDRFYIQFASKILVMIIFVSSLNLLVGFTGLVSLRHAAFLDFQDMSSHS